MLQATEPRPRVTIVVPVHNEEAAILPFANELFSVCDTNNTSCGWQFVFVNDGSNDETQNILEGLARHRSDVSVIEFSRNFGKEAATSAGLAEADGDAVIMIDADLQHPPEHLPKFIEKWQAGADVVIGIRKNDASDAHFKKVTSRLYYKVVNAISDEVTIIPRATDYRLLDRRVVDEFVRLTEHNRMTRGLIDWLGFKRDYIYFETPERQNGEASYTSWKLMKLATSSFIAHSLLPLRLAGYLGIFITVSAGCLGLFMFIDRFVTSLGFYFSGPAMLATLILFMVGIVLVAIGLLAYYIAYIYAETQNRPLYVVRQRITGQNINN